MDGTAFDEGGGRRMKRASVRPSRGRIARDLKTIDPRLFKPGISEHLGDSPHEFATWVAVGPAS